MARSNSPSSPAAAKAGSLLAPQGLNDLLLYRLARLSAVAGARVVRLCEGQFGITRREFRMLALLAEGGPLQPSLLAELAQLDRARTSRSISGLVGKKLVRRTAVAHDARLAEVALTPAGRELYAALFPQVAAINHELLSVLGTAQVRELQAALMGLQQQAERLAVQAPFPKARGRGRREASAL